MEMPSPITVKICGVTRPQDGECALRLGADFIGINLYPKSPRYLPEEKVSELLQIIPQGKRVLVDVNTAPEDLERYKRLGFDYYQIHFNHNTELQTLAQWESIVGYENLWLAPRVPPTEQFPQDILEHSDTIVFDAYSPVEYGGSGKTGDWGRFHELNTLYNHKNWILAGGLKPENVEEALTQTGATFIDIASGVESAPGVKSRPKLEALFANLQKAHE